MKLFVSSTTDIVEKHVRKIHPDSVCITEDNLEINAEVGFTSLEEFIDKDNLLNLLIDAEELIYISDSQTVDLHDPGATGKGHIEYLLLVSNRNFEGRELVSKSDHNFLELIDQRKSDDQQLWGVGCSFTAGKGVEESKRYIEHLSRKINLPYSLLAKPGTSIEWQADQILRSDIREKDIVIWGLTTRYRFPLWIKGLNNEFPFHVNHISHDLHGPVKKIVSRKFFLEDDHFMYNAMTHIAQVENFCKKSGAELLLFGLLTSPSDVFYYDLFPRFYQYTEELIDHADDGKHPGPLQHKRYAEFMYERMKQNGLVP